VLYVAFRANVVAIPSGARMGVEEREVVFAQQTPVVFDAE